MSVFRLSGAPTVLVFDEDLVDEEAAQLTLNVRVRLEDERLQNGDVGEMLVEGDQKVTHRDVRLQVRTRHKYMSVQETEQWCRRACQQVTHRDVRLQAYESQICVIT